MPTPTASELITVSDFTALTDSEDYELLAGRLIRRDKGNRVAWITGNLAAELAAFVNAHHLGWVFTSPAGFILDCTFATVLRPSVSFVRFGRLPNETPADTLDQLAPDLAVEVVSPRDKVLELDARIDAFLTAGVREVWIVNPQRHAAKLYQFNGKVVSLRQMDALDGGEIVPGFRCRVADVVHLPQTSRDGQLSRP
jgi:Uma2 family endonuclease